MIWVLHHVLTGKYLLFCIFRPLFPFCLINVQKANFDLQLQCEAPVCWSKYATNNNNKQFTYTGLCRFTERVIVNLDLKWHKSSWKDILDYMHFQLVLLFPNKSKFGLILNPSLFYVFKVLTDKVLTDNRLTAFVNKLTWTAIDIYLDSQTNFIW